MAALRPPPPLPLLEAMPRAELEAFTRMLHGVLVNTASRTDALDEQVRLLKARLEEVEKRIAR